MRYSRRCKHPQWYVVSSRQNEVAQKTNSSSWQQDVALVSNKRKKPTFAPCIHGYVPISTKNVPTCFQFFNVSIAPYKACLKVQSGDELEMTMMISEPNALKEGKTSWHFLAHMLAFVASNRHLGHKFFFLAQWLFMGWRLVPCVV